MSGTSFIQVIVPLRLEWEPYYILEGAAVGDRVQVSFAHREYVGVVSAVNVVPEAAPERIQEAKPSGLPPIHPREIAFWRAIADYYLCSVGEVYKAAYPALKQESEAIQLRANERLHKRLALLKEKLQKARKEETRERYAGEIGRLEAFLRGEKASLEQGAVQLSPAQEKAAEAVRKGFLAGKTVLLEGACRMEVYLQLAQDTLAQGRSVLYMVPEIGLSQQLEDRITEAFPGVLVYHSARSAAQRRAVADAIREGRPEFVLGTRSALFLPHRNLGLVILDQEHDVSYKQDSPAPRYQARESAILLAGIHRAQVLLGSSTPSLESLYNAETGKFVKVDLKDNSSIGNGPEILLVNTAAEVRKKGMLGSFSLKLLEQMNHTLEAGKKVLLVCRSKAAEPECAQELETLLGARPKGIVLATPASAKGEPEGAFGLTAVIRADGLLAKEDFRCDERAIQILRQLRDRCEPGGMFVIQTWEAAHPVFREFTRDHTAQLLAERLQFGYPPYTRLIHVSIKDNNGKRGPYMARELAEALRREIPGQTGNDGSRHGRPGSAISIEQYMLNIRIILPRDKALLARKQALASAVARFEKTRKYPGHIVIDVDPV